MTMPDSCRSWMSVGRRMLVADVNVLVDAHRPEGRRHVQIGRWLDAARTGSETLAITGVVASGFLRTVTSRRVFQEPTGIDEALAFLDALYASPAVRRVEPGPGHWSAFSDLCRRSRATADLVPDAWLAGFAIAERATLITSDRGFGRYPGLRWRDPLDD